MANKGQFKPKDRTGEVHGHFTVIRDTGKKAKNGSHIWECVCDCGTTFEEASDRIGRIKSCGCKRVKNSGMYAGKDWSGSVVRGFKVLEETGKRNNGYAVWKAQCMYCGEVKEFPSYYFVRKVVSCSCSKWVSNHAEETGRKPIPNNGAHVNELYNHYKRSAKQRNLEFALTKEQARKLFEGDCFYCGQNPQARPTSQNLHGTYSWNGIDRVDNSKGYTVDNTVSCCKVCNFAKRDSTKEEFVEWIKRAYKHITEKEGDAE